MSVEINVKNEEETDILGRVLANALPPGTVVALIGALGAGKTRLVQGVCEALSISKDNVGSPTFVLIREYQGTKRSVYHFDAYRLQNSVEFLDLGVDEYFDSEGLSFVEWADKVEDAMPDKYLEISVFPVGDQARRFTIAACGELDSSLENLILTEWQKVSSPQ